MTAGVRLYVLGGFRLETAQGEPLSISLRKAEALLAYLAIAPGKTTSREKLAALLWGESDQQRARQSLRQALFALTREFARAEVGVLRMESQMVSLDPISIWVDACEFQDLAAKGDPDSLAKATAHYTGEFLQDFTVDSPDFEDWLASNRNRLEEVALKAFVDFLDHQEAAGDIPAAIELAQGALRIDAYREDIHRRLMRLYMAKGMRSSALHQYRQCREFLDRELNVLPDEETNALYKSILEDLPTAAPALDARSEKPDPAPRPKAGQGTASSSPVSVGRTEELQGLLRRSADVEDGGAHLVVLVDEAGAGKTHLLEQFQEALAARDATILTARGRRTDLDLPFGACGALLRGVDLGEGTAWNERLTPEARDSLDRLCSGRAAMAGGLADAGPERHGLHEAVIEVLRLAAAQRPIVCLIDDAQWVDDDSLRLVASVLPRLADVPVLFVMALSPKELAREDLLSKALHDFERDGRASSITLPPLSKAEIGELAQQVRQAAGGARLSESELNDVWWLSEGNPRIALEALTLGAEPDDGPGDGRAKIPQRIFTDLSRLLAPVSETGQTLAGLASVIGADIDFDVLARASGLDQGDVVPAVEELVAAGLLKSRGAGFAFLRQRDRIALHARLLPQRRRELHGAVAQSIEELHGEEIEPYLTILASHYREAGQGPKALMCDLAGGYRDLKRGAQSKARKTFQGVLKRAQDLTGSDYAAALVDARLGLALGAEVEQDLDKALAILKSLEQEFDRIDDPRQRIATLIALSRVTVMCKDEDSAYSYARRALRRAGQAGMAHLWLPADCLLLRLHQINGAVAQTAAKLAARRDRAEGLQLYEDEAAAASGLGVLQAVQGNFPAAMDQCERAVQVAERLADERSLGAALQFRGMIQMWQGACDAALLDFDKAGKIAQDRGDLLRLYSVTGHRGFALAADRRYDDALADFEAALAMAERLNTKAFVPLFMAWMTEASFEAGARDSALHLGREAARLAAEANQPWPRSIALRTLARVLAHPDVRDLEGAEKSIRSAIDDQEGLGLRFEKARSMVVQAKIVRAAGNTRQSSAIYGEASKMFQQMRMTGEFDSARNMSEVLQPGDDTSA